MSFSQAFRDPELLNSRVLRRFASLIEPKDAAELETMAADAEKLTRQNFGKTMRLFIVDTGAFRTSISPEAAREVTKVHSDGRSQVKGISGNVENVFSGDKVVVRFAGLQQESDNMLSFDTSGLSQHMGTDISGFLGFDLLHFLVLSIDYRDGLVDFQYSRDRGYQHIR